ncbi:acetyltransferase [Sphaerisporangium siamense]|uniref:Ribosomal protein S18 acetylase RimI-like enzyme n=1 Tax=Sphaerisporangium siamense TaxID=795645 RepID=A0A7W7GDV3_9ACTN|nr:GNAT family N-acetyltransferase [Sphaerisporangium siamense]MBB4704859.1 ribosomal protein S18 acetylase RimI-like enzyme [Sphaerisporangium siamense]GII83661.1 acetyltransferase [Sphaerisporangium siamense]
MIELRRAGAAEFTAELDTVIRIYTAAMRPPPEQLAGRQGIMRNHATFPDFTCLFAETYDGAVAGFGYGFHGAPGQWWHDVVRRGLEDREGAAVAAAWFEDALEIAEIHVHPGYQGKGIGRRLVRGLCEGRRERTAVLSTHDRPTAARHLYRTLGFVDLMEMFVFPGGYEHYAIVGSTLPLRAADPAAARPGRG